MEAKSNSVFYSILNLWSFISKKRKKHFYLLLVLMLASAFAEILSLGSIIPFIAMLTSPDRLLEIQFIKSASLYFGINDKYLLITFTCIFCFAVIIAAYAESYFYISQLS